MNNDDYVLKSLSNDNFISISDHSLRFEGDINDTNNLEQIIWSVPKDGGTPRDLNRIKRVRSNEFHIRTP